MNLLKADFYRLFKSRIFYVLVALTFVMPPLTCAMFPEMTVERVIFQGLDTTLACAITGIMIAVFVGNDYANNTIRNKICYGEKRLKVMTFTFAESALLCLIFVAVSAVSSLIFGGIICEFAFSSEFFAKLICQILILLAFSSVAAAITMCSKSLKAGLIVALLISVLLSAVGQILPMLSVTNNIASFLCRILYSTVSSNMLNGTGGTYVYTSYTQAGAEAAVFNHTYLNSVVLAVAYIAAAVGISAAVVKKQSYK